MTAEATGRITRDDIEAKFRELSGGVSGQVEEMKPRLATAAIGVGVVLLTAAYLLGRRRGRRKTAVVEIRRL
ncbi:MAG: hypothetical protein ACYCUF_08880 [Acidimicrobiales bacterium]|jgi:hypothetical protein|nr:hypothetical protein [Actinomycetota bacterium]